MRKRDTLLWLVVLGITAFWFVHDLTYQLKAVWVGDFSKATYYLVLGNIQLTCFCLFLVAYLVVRSRAHKETPEDE